ncbi:MAG: thiol reductant ABC exporter subunit CydC [Chloroflexi bacterium]|nr:thiol reductant ABC exporter subunit CydC [Chloroflexota bacterium]
MDQRSTFWRLVGLVKPFAKRMVLAASLGMATIASGIGLLATSAYIISRSALHPSIAVLHVPIAMVRFFGISRGLFRYAERLTAHDVAFRLLARLRVWFYQALEPLAPARLLQFQSGDLLARIVADVESLEHFYVRVLAPPFIALMTLALMWALLAPFSVTMALVFTLVMVLAGVGVPVLTRYLSRTLGTRLVQVRAELNTALVDGVQGEADLLAYGREEAHRERVRALSEEMDRLQARMARITGLQVGLSAFMVYLAVAAALAVAVPLVHGGHMNGVYLAVVVMAIMASFEAVMPLPGVFQHLEGSLAAARRLFEIVDAEPAVKDPPTPSPEPRDYSIRADRLTFRYRPSDPPALVDVSFTLPEGGKLAVVGPSGAGKSTLVNLLLRFWDYEEGHIYLGGHELRSYHQDDARRLMSVISQNTYLFNGTVRDNLLLAKPDATDEEIVAAARRARIHDMIMSLPDGYDTWIGEQGLRLSGGQRQRLAIARALLKDAPILILDEATASLDALVEQEIMEAIFEVMADRTMLIITHRLVGLDRVDEILVLSHGRVVERGTHRELLTQNGLYRRMWEHQRQVLAIAL